MAKTPVPERPHKTECLYFPQYHADMIKDHYKEFYRYTFIYWPMGHETSLTVAPNRDQEFKVNGALQEGRTQALKEYLENSEKSVDKK